MFQALNPPLGRQFAAFPFLKFADSVCKGGDMETTRAGAHYASGGEDSEPVTCRLCGKPILKGEARYREPDGDVHADCRDKAGRRIAPP
jgi:hypothetical protein